ncbi:MAG: gfo/Idh/MocA family oxidoreductase, partial [Proteobacteria bacterium]|nr:gfo/Idh/MocA family oxidoreductase [Pseudomonadota bacterium]
MQKIKWGIIGPGSIATGFAHSVEHCQNSELTGVFGRTKEKANDFAK